jgi:hypothetical protein
VGKPLGVDRKLLGIYLNDHLAGATAGRNLAQRFVGENEGNEYGRQMAPIAREIDEDREVLCQVMRGAGVRRKQLRQGLAHVAELAARLKPNGRLVGYSRLSRVIELEGLTVGISGKLELWRSLRAIEADPEVPDVDYTQLAARAESQRDRVEQLRVKAAAEALGG